MTDPWPTDWRDRTLKAIARLGQPSVAAFISSRPGRSYTTMAEEIGCVSMQLRLLHLAEAVRFGATRAAAMESLVRILGERLRFGWGAAHGDAHGDALVRAVGIEWMVLMRNHLDDPEAGRMAEAVWATLITLAPPNGWRPASTDDLIVQKAFAEAWP